MPAKKTMPAKPKPRKRAAEDNPFQADPPKGQQRIGFGSTSALPSGPSSSQRPGFGSTSVLPAARSPVPAVPSSWLSSSSVPVAPTPHTLPLGDGAPSSSSNAPPPSSPAMDCSPPPRVLLPLFQSEAVVVGPVASGSGDAQQPYGQCSNDTLERALFGEIFGDDTDTETLVMGGDITVKVTADSLEVTKANNDDADPGAGNAATGSTGDISVNANAAGPDDNSATDKDDQAVANGSTGDVNGKDNSENPGDMQVDAPTDDIAVIAKTTSLDAKINNDKDDAAVANGSTSDVNGGVTVNVNTGIKSRGQWIADGITATVNTENLDAKNAKDSDDAANGSSSTADVNANVTTNIVDGNAPHRYVNTHSIFVESLNVLLFKSVFIALGANMTHCVLPLTQPRTMVGPSRWRLMTMVLLAM
jgi:hypothetical protein